MHTASVCWEEALRSFLLHVKATRADATCEFYETQLTMLCRWAELEHIPLDRFGKREMDAYLVYRSEEGNAHTGGGVSETTLHHDSLCAKVFLKWCVKYDVLDRSPLADYQIRRAPKPPKYMPSQEDMQTLLAATSTFWERDSNSSVRYVNLSRLSFHRERNHAILITLLDSACRIGEILSLKVEDYRKEEARITITKAKGREPREIPVSEPCAAAIADWLKIRSRVMKSVPVDEDQGWLFMSETGTRLAEHRFLKTLRRITDFVGLTDKITLHSLRRYSLNRLAKTNLLAAQLIAGHKDTKTTLGYTQIDPDFIRAEHAKAGVLGGILVSKRSVRKKSLL